ncbi:MAG: tRNA (adenosine(37)-N6)-threonylcarbamoyltransferase complex ATPase subunit type 1 TsaE [Weeksellaceae bacterium]|jgi:tRNA threonylcarbamoyladenosine biosynthesis protein TsaE|nr:tRNA (adenosine(37)-N6)-threonylcarbamoyltransferase complex ATPase subunit type 1 TsaE [Weeksellaceae bacterium]
MDFQISSLEQLDETARKLLSEFSFKIILFEGELGVGKTTLIKALLAAMGSKDKVSSPTFSIVNEYKIPDGKVYHLDLYRIKSTEEALDFGLEQYLDSGDWCLIEWPDTAMNLLSEDYHTIKIIDEEGRRNIFFD